MTLLALADRVEGLTGGDREVDFLIAEALSADKDHWLGCRVRQDRWFHMSDWKVEHPIPVRWEWSQPLYTASLDAAMSLVPDDFNFSVDRIGSECGAVVNRTPFTKTAAISNRCATPALALTAACLRARASASS